MEIIIKFYLLYCMHGVNGSFKLSYHSPCVTVPILSCGYGRGRELWAIGRLKPASARQTDKERESAARYLSLPQSVWLIWISFENGSANYVDYLPRLASVGNECIFGMDTFGRLAGRLEGTLQLPKQVLMGYLFLELR